MLGRAPLPACVLRSPARSPEIHSSCIVARSGEMSGQEHRLEPQIPEQHMSGVSARLWLQRGVTLGRLLRALASQTVRLWHRLPERLVMLLPRRTR
jgi:hypothetical protein